MMLLAGVLPNQFFVVLYTFHICMFKKNISVKKLRVFEKLVSLKNGFKRILFFEKRVSKTAANIIQDFRFDALFFKKDSKKIIIAKLTGS